MIKLTTGDGWYFLRLVYRALKNKWIENQFVSNLNGFYELVDVH